jgi:hypothetical protein
MQAALTPGQAAARARLAEAFQADELAPTRAGLAAGDLSVGHAGVIVRAMDTLAQRPEPLDPDTAAEAQALLVGAAAQVDSTQLAILAKRLTFRLTPDAADRLAKDEDAQERAREAYLFQERSGMWRLSALLPPVAGAKLRAALDPLAAPAPTTEDGPDPRSGRQRMADALARLAHLALAARPGTPGALPTQGGAATRMLITTDLDTALARMGVAGNVGQAGLAPGELATGEPGGWPLSPLTVQTLACDAEIVPVLLDSTGNPLDVGRTRYPFPPKIRRAIEIRDKHCTFGNCRVPPQWCDVHHLTPFSQGGKTSAENGTILCGPDHRRVHAAGWTGELTNGHIRWRQPTTGQGFTNTRITQTERAIDQLARRWLLRNPHLRQ